MAKRVVRALGLIFGCIFTASLVRGFLSDALLNSSQSMCSSLCSAQIFPAYVLQIYVHVVVICSLYFGLIVLSYYFQGYTAAINLIELSWQYTPRIVYYYQVQ